MEKIIFLLTLLIFISCNNEKNDLNNAKVLTDQSKIVKAKTYSICCLETYLEYKDSLPLYSKPNEKIVKYFRFEDDPEYDYGGSFVFKQSKLGWLQIGKDEFYPDLEGFWVKSEFIKIGTTNYDNSKIPLFKKPNKNSKIIGYLAQESYLNVLNCQNDWVFVEKDNKFGWLSPNYICTNPVTNCN